MNQQGTWLDLRAMSDAIDCDIDRCHADTSL
jgi:hypothetical protein